MNQRRPLSNYQKSLSLVVQMLKQSIEDSRLLGLLETSMKELEKGYYTEIRSSYMNSHIHKIDMNIKLLQDILNDFQLRNGFLSKIKNFFFNDTFGSLSQLKVELVSRFNCEEFNLSPSSASVDCVLIKANQPPDRPEKPDDSQSSVTSNKDSTCPQSNVMIICGPNGCSYEVFAYSEKWIEYYMDLGVSVVLWNYRGYGSSKGRVDFTNMKTDAECIVDFLKKHYQFTKIGVHGISIGGIPASHLAAKGLVDVCFADRTFSSVDSIAESSFSLNLKYIYKCLFFKTSDNVLDYVNSSSFKVISSDPSDSIIRDMASLKSGVSHVIAQDIKQKFFSDSRSHSTLLQSILSDPVEYESFLSNLEMFLFKLSNSSRARVVQVLNGGVQYDRLTEDFVQTDRTNILTDENVTRVEESKIYFSLKNIVDKFDSAGDNLFTLLSFNSTRLKRKFIDSFFENLLVWGSYKIGNVFATDKNIIYRAVSKKFYLLNLKINKIVNDQEKYAISDIVFYNCLRNLLGPLLKIETLFNKVIFKSSLNMITVSLKENGDSTDKASSDYSVLSSREPISQETYKTCELSEFILSLNIGHLLPLQCGHNGPLNFSESEMYSLYLINSGFITN